MNADGIDPDDRSPRRPISAGAATFRAGKSSAQVMSLSSTSIYEAIEHSDWEGLLTLYASVAYDAIYSAAIARHGAVGWAASSPQNPLPMDAAAGRLRREASFRDEKKSEQVHQLGSSQHRTCKSGPTFPPSARSVLYELDCFVREVTGAESFDDHQTEPKDSGSSLSARRDDQGQPHKKTRQNSPHRKVPQELHALDHVVHQRPHSQVPLSRGGRNLSSKSHLVAGYDASVKRQARSPGLFHCQSSPCGQRSSTSRREHNMEWEKTMWESAFILSNSRPSSSFVVRQRQRNVNNKSISNEGASVASTNQMCSNLKSDTDTEVESIREETNSRNINDLEDQDDYHPSTPPLFEGSVANSTPGDPADGGAGSGTAQHLACLLDSPLALAILIVLRVNIEARHTAFRRLAVHEAACADSPNCLDLLLGAGARYWSELSRGTTSFAASSRSSIASSASSYSSESSSSRPGSPFNGHGYPQADPEGGSRHEEGNRKLHKMKLNIFSGWHIGKSDNSSIAGRYSPMRGCLSADEATIKKKYLDSTSYGASDPESTGEEIIPFRSALKTIWEVIQKVRSGQLNEVDASRQILSQVSVPKKTMKALALQCPHLPSLKDDSHHSASVQSSPFASFPGYATLMAAANSNISFNPPHNSYNSSYGLCNVDGHGNTPLHWAAFKNSVRAMNVLLSHNVDVNSRAHPSGWTPLHDAAYSDSADAVARLLSAGAHVDARSHSGATPLCFASQEDAPNATRLLLEAGADPSMRCLGQSPGVYARANHGEGHFRQQNQQFHSRFSGYTPLHYCAHYNAARAARVLLFGSQSQQFHPGLNLLEIPDLNEKLPIHVAVARGSSEVLRELLHGGARVETSSHHHSSPKIKRVCEGAPITTAVTTDPVSIPNESARVDGTNASSTREPTFVVTPVSSPILRSMIPSHPITSSKPWNCLSQKAIDTCKYLIEEAELNWTPERHPLFSPTDRLAVVEVLRVGKRLEQRGTGIFPDLWPLVLSFCGRGWFEELGYDSVSEDTETPRVRNGVEDVSMQSSTSGESSDGGTDFTQFQLDGANVALL